MFKPLSEADCKQIEKAVTFATAAHAGQTDFNGQPYILHPLRVMTTVHAEGGSVVEIIAAVLHDVVEDTEVTIEQIKKHFGRDVAELVDILTHKKDKTYKEYVEFVTMFTSTVKIKMADLRDNMDPDRVTADKHSLYKRHAEAYHRLKYGENLRRRFNRGND